MEENKTHTVLRFNPTKMSREYGSNIYITKGDKTDRIQLRTSVIYAGLFMDKYPIFHLNKQDVYINKTAPDEHSYRLAETCGKTFYPIVAICDKEGQVVGIRNDLIQQRWLKLKPNIEREFVGEYAKRYIRQTDKNLMNRDKTLELVSKDLFLDSFFSLKYNYLIDIDREIDKQIPLFAFNPSLKTKGVQKNRLDEDHIYVDHTGLIVDENKFNYNSLLNRFDNLGYGTVKGTYTINYELDLHSRVIDSMMFDTTLTTEDGADLMQIKMESYYLSEYPLENIDDKNTIELGEQIQKEEAKQDKKNRKPFWQRFKDYLNKPL